jgi:hypothetical protein
VDEPVDKHCFLGRTARVLWMNCGWLKNLEIRDRNPLCGPHRRRRTALTTGDGYRPGGDLGAAGRVGKPALAAGIRDRWQVRQGQAAEQSVRGCCRAGRGPSISYMEGPPPILPEGHPAGMHRHAEDCGEQCPLRARAKCHSPSQIPGDPVAYTNPATRLLSPGIARGAWAGPRPARPGSRRPGRSHGSGRYAAGSRPRASRHSPRSTSR